MNVMLSAFDEMRGLKQPEVFYATELDESQMHEIEYAKENTKEGDLIDIVGELQKHPEYDSTLMNTLRNRWANGNPCVELLEFCKIWGPDDKGHIGSYKVLEEYWDWEDKVPGEIMNSYSRTFKDKGIKYCVFKAAEEVFGLRKRNSRIKLTEDILNHRGKLFSVMAEGDVEAYGILEKIEYMTGQLHQNESRAWGEFSAGALGSHLMPGKMRMLGLDDMNIRGRQLVYAFEYADMSYEALIKLISDNDENMVKYVNKKMYEDLSKSDEHAVPKAVTVGASFDDPTWNDILFLTSHDWMEIEEYGDVKPLSTDWEHAEIVNFVPKTDAIKIMEANGFHIVHRRVPTGAEYEEIIFHNKETGAIASCGATDDNCCYGGFTIAIAHSGREYGFNGGVQTNSLDNGEGYKSRMTYQNALMSNYDKYKHLDPIKDTTVLGYGLDDEIPIPAMIYTNKFVIHRDWKHNELCGIMRDNSYQLTEFINCLYVNVTYRELAEEDKWLYKPFMDCYWYNVLKASYFCNSVYNNCIILGAVLKVAGVPKEQIDLLYEEIHRQCEFYDDRNPSRGWNNCSTYVGTLEDSKKSLYGSDKLVDYLIDEFDLDKLGLPRWEV